MDIIDNLKMFNRKERFYLVGMALGSPDFKLSTEFRSTLGQTFHLDVPENAFCAMDYHLDWIYASIFLYFNTNNSNVYNPKKIITATQEDVDLLVSWQGKDGVCHIVILDAKGETGWSNRQLNLKTKRLKGIFDEENNGKRHISPHFAIGSPKEPQRLITKEWPTWMKTNGKVRRPVW